MSNSPTAAELVHMVGGGGTLPGHDDWRRSVVVVVAALLIYNAASSDPQTIRNVGGGEVEASSTTKTRRAVEAALVEHTVQQEVLLTVGSQLALAERQGPWQRLGRRHRGGAVHTAVASRGEASIIMGLRQRNYCNNNNTSRQGSGCLQRRSGVPVTGAGHHGGVQEAMIAAAPGNNELHTCSA